jgi:hypothetical protein
VNLGKTYTIVDLQGAEATTLPIILETPIVQGAAGFAVIGQTAATVVAANITPGTPEALKAWAKEQLQAFFLEVEILRRQALQLSTSAPNSAWAWTEDNGDAGDG